MPQAQMNWVTTNKGKDRHRQAAIKMLYENMFSDEKARQSGYTKLYDKSDRTRQTDQSISCRRASKTNVTATYRLLAH